MDAGGYIRVDDLLAWKKLKQMKVSKEMIIECVENCSKKRYELKSDGEGSLFIRAT